MYSHLYIHYRYEHDGLYESDEPRKIHIALQNSEDAVGFRMDMDYMDDDGYPQTANHIRQIGKYHCREYDINKSIIQEIPIDVPVLVQSTKLYIPFSSKDVADNVYFAVDQALNELNKFDYVNEYTIIKDPEMYNIELQFAGTLCATTLEFPLTNQTLAVYIRKTLDGKTEYIKGPKWTNSRFQETLDQIKKLEAAETAVATTKREREEALKRQANEKAQLLQKLTQLPNEKLKALLNQ